MEENNNNQYQAENQAGYQGEYQAGYQTGYQDEYQNPNNDYYMNNETQQTMGLTDYAGGTFINNFGDEVQYTAPAPKKNKKGLKIALFSVLAAVVVVALAAIIFILVRKTPEEKIKDAIKNTINSSEFTSAIDDELGLSEMSEDNIDLETNLNFSGTSESDIFEGFGVSMDASYEKGDNDLGSMNFDLALSQNGESISMDVTVIDSIIYLAVPELFDDMMKMDLYSLAEETDYTSSESEAAQELYKEYIEPAVDDLTEKVTYEKVGKTTVTNYNNDDVKCTQYTMTIPEDALRDYIDAFVKYFEAYADESLDDEWFDELGTTRDEFYSYLEMVPSYWNMIFSRDIAIDFYIEKKDLVRVSVDYKIILFGANATMVVDFMGDEAPTSDYYFKLAIEMDNDNSEDSSSTEYEYYLSGRGTTDESDNQITKTFNMDIASNEEVFSSITKTDSYDKSTDKYSTTMELSDEDDIFLAYSLSGTFTDINKGTSFAMSVDSLTFTVENEVICDVNGEVKYGNLEKEISAPDDTVNIIDYTEFTNEYITSNINMDNLKKISEALDLDIGLLFGIDTGLNLDDFENTSDDESEEIEVDVNGEDTDEIEIDYDEYFSEDTDYSGIDIASDNYTVSITEPSGSERVYADESEIDISCDDYSAYYSISENCNIETECAEILSYYDYLGDDCEIFSNNMINITANGVDMQCYTIESNMYDYYYLEMIYFYPISDTDYVIVDVYYYGDFDGSDAIPEVAESTATLIVNKDVINVQNKL